MSVRLAPSSAVVARLAAVLALAAPACGDDAGSGTDDTVDATGGVDAVDGLAEEVGGDAVGGDADDAAVVEPVARWQVFEATLDDRPVTEDNPFDPREVAIDATFRAPDGAEATVPAFVYQAYERALVDGRERLSAVGDRQWRVRFRPPAGSPGGAWSWRWQATGTSGEATSDWKTFTPTPEVAGHGVVRVSPTDPRALAHEDGTPFIAIGENLAWAGARGTFDYDDWMARLAAVGATYVRLWMPSWGMSIEWGALGDYGGRLDRAWQLDHVLGEAEARGLEVMLTIQNHGPFSELHASEWAGNPYNAANGGPLARPTEVFTDPEARRLFAQRLRYLVARWGASPSLLAWELWNEVDLVAEPNGADVMAWTAAMAGELRRLDASRHLVTTSVAGADVLGALLNDDVASLTARYAFWSMPELDLVQLHLYGFGGVELDFARALADLAGYLGAFGKPALVAECGVSAASAEDTLTLDPHGVGFHDILWAGLFAGTVGTGMAWWWDGLVDPESYYDELAPVADLVSDPGAGGGGTGAAAAIDASASAGAEVGATLYARALRGAGRVLAWVKNADDQWFSEDARAIAGARLEVAGVAAGTWRARFVDPRPGDDVVTDAPAVSVVVGADDVLALDLPTFARDLAVRFDRVGD